TVRLDPMREPPRGQYERPVRDPHLGTGDRLLGDDLSVGEHRRVTQPPPVLRTAPGKDRTDRMPHPVPRDPLDDPGHPEAVVAMEVRDTDPGDVMRTDPGARHLPLRP